MPYGWFELTALYTLPPPPFILAPNLTAAEKADVSAPSKELFMSVPPLCLAGISCLQGKQRCEEQQLEHAPGLSVCVTALVVLAASTTNDFSQSC